MFKKFLTKYFTKRVNKNKSLRLKYYTLLKDYVVYKKGLKLTGFLCHYPCNYSNFLKWDYYIDWKQLKEVQELENSENIIIFHRGNLKCDRTMFFSNNRRLAFLDECIELCLKESH